MNKRLNIAMIMDGNRRWAVNNNLPKVKGHEYGAKKLEEVLNWCKEKNINSLTLYTFSIENFNRSEEEKLYIFKLFENYFKKIIKQIQNNELENVQIKFLGEIELFPEKIQNQCKKIIEKTKNNDKFILQFCFGYGGRNEILNSVKQIIINNHKIEEINKDLFEKYLYTSIEPDIVIRTSGEVRLSNFLPWQTSYSEWFFTKTLWPDFSENEFNNIIEEFNSRERRKGK